MSARGPLGTHCLALDFISKGPTATAPPPVGHQRFTMQICSGPPDKQYGGPLATLQRLAYNSTENHSKIGKLINFL